MTPKWPVVRLATVVEDLTNSRSFYVNDDDEIIDPTITSATHSISVSGKSKGRDVKVRKRVRIDPGDLVFSRLHTQNGAFAFADQSFQATNTFMPLAVNEQRVERRFLFWALHQRVPSLSASDTVGRETFKADEILKLEFPLPSLSEQKRLASFIEHIVELETEARALHQQSVFESEALLGTAFGVRFATLAKRFPVVPLGELTSHILDGPHITPAYLPEGVPGIPFVTVKNMVTGKLSFSNLNYISYDDHRVFTRRCKPENGDVLYSKDGATRGRPCLVDTDREFSYFVSVALIKPIRGRLNGKYLVHLLNSNWIKTRMQEKSRGDMIPHIVLREIRQFPVPLPSLLEQQEIVEQLDGLQSEVQRLRSLQSETAVQLNALLPSILHRAFSGVL